MKKSLFFSVMLIVLLALGFVACDSSSDNGGGGNGDINFVGFWDGVFTHESMSFNVVIDLRANSSYFMAIVEMPAETDTGTYVVMEDVIVFTSTDGSVFHGEILSENTLSLLMGDGVAVTFTRR